MVMNSPNCMLFHIERRFGLQRNANFETVLASAVKIVSFFKVLPFNNRLLSELCDKIVANICYVDFILKFADFPGESY